MASRLAATSTAAAARLIASPAATLDLIAKTGCLGLSCSLGELPLPEDGAAIDGWAP